MATQYNRKILLAGTTEAGGIVAILGGMLLSATVIPLLAASIGAMLLIARLGMAVGYGAGLLLDKSIKQRLVEREAQAASSPIRVNEKATILAPAPDNSIADTNFVDRYKQEKAASRGQFR